MQKQSQMQMWLAVELWRHRDLVLDLGPANSHAG